jgi:hypothetical protein
VIPRLRRLRYGKERPQEALVRIEIEARSAGSKPRVAVTWSRAPTEAERSRLGESVIAAVLKELDAGVRVAR